MIVNNSLTTCLVCDGVLTNNQFCGCDEGYYPLVNECISCSENCRRCDLTECFDCDDGYEFINGNCTKVTDGFYSHGVMLICNDFTYLDNNECLTCSSNCKICSDSTNCLLCNDTILTNNECISKSIGDDNVINEPISCLTGYYLNGTECLNCKDIFGDDCEKCNLDECLICSNGVIINDNSCSLNTNCLKIEESKCLICNDKGSWFNGNECIKCNEGCSNCEDGICLTCYENYFYNASSFECINNTTLFDNCELLSKDNDRCIRCEEKGYYLKDNLCHSCPNDCTSCYNSTYCFECNDGYMLNESMLCEEMTEALANCKTAIPNGGGCAICFEGYYRVEISCSPCISNCNKCNTDENCLICNDNYFLKSDSSECISYDELTNCEIPTQSGCSKCNDSYYLNNQYCTSCSDITENCNTCKDDYGICTSCQNDYILINYECIHYSLIDNCKESSNSKCISCSFWHRPNSNETGCEKQVVWWVIVLIILFILIIFIGICVLIIFGITKYLDYKKVEEQRKLITIFDMSKSNIKFLSTENKDVVINKEILLFNDECEEIGVNEETRDLICVGNSSKNTIKVQFSVKKGCDKYEIRTNPQLITIPKGKAVEFEIFIKPLCTCFIDDQIMLISANLKKGKTNITPIHVETQTIMTSRLDYDELTEEDKLGEGSFGIVYKGTFRENIVAIKKMKQLNNNKKALDEFEKEITMLDKFRNDYIVHFYGAVFIPTKICMVTELAQFGSLQDLMKKRKENPINKQLKVKLSLDCSKGISYLHSNGILHRDIKPDNFLIFSLENDVPINAKLTDFGSSRNINMMMTNMTFTNGIGTPKYMAPEILNRNKYKKSADIYSFAITIYEIMIWGNAYPISMFRFPWDIADFISSGKHLPQTNNMSDDIYDLISNCWCYEPTERYAIEEIISKLHSFN